MCKSKWDAEPIKLTHFTDEDGCLCPIEFTALSFCPQRTFYVSNVPKGMRRGSHAHYKTVQFLVCVQGQIIVNLSNGIDDIEHLLSPGEAVYVQKMVWDSQVFLTGSDVLLVLCSTCYDKSDYIEDLEQFKRIVRERLE